MTDVNKGKKRVIKYIDDLLSTGVEINLTKLYILVLRNFGVGQQSVDSYLELLWKDEQIVIDKATNTIKKKQSRIDDLLAVHVSDFGKPVSEENEEGDDE